MERVQYKQFIIKPRVTELRDGGFGAQAVIEEHYGGGVNVTPVHLKETFTTQEESKRAVLRAGKQVIDRGDL